MARSLYLIWRDVRGPEWTRRARVYEPGSTERTWRVELIDPTHRVNVYVPDVGTARDVVATFESGVRAIDVRDHYESKEAPDA